MRELAADVARSPFGQGAAWPVVQTVQADGICVEVIAPAPRADRRARRRGAGDGAAAGPRAGRRRRARGRAVRGRRAATRARSATTAGGCSSTSWRCARTTRRTGRSRARAPRSSSSTCARCSTIRSARRRRRRRSTVMANLLAGADDVRAQGHRRAACTTAWRAWPDVKIHLYGKAFRPGRKVGHVTALGDRPGRGARPGAGRRRLPRERRRAWLSSRWSA